MVTIPERRELPYLSRSAERKLAPNHLPNPTRPFFLTASISSLRFFFRAISDWNIQPGELKDHNQEVSDGLESEDEWRNYSARYSTFGVVWVQPWCGPVVWVGVLRARCSTPCKASTLLADVPHLGDRQGEMSRPSEQPNEPQLLTLPEHLVENILAKAYPLGAAPDSDRFSPLGLLSLAAVDRILRRKLALSPDGRPIKHALRQWWTMG